MTRGVPPIAVWEHLTFFNAAPLVWQLLLSGCPVTAQSSLRPVQEMLLLKYITLTLMGTKLQLGLEILYISEKNPFNVWPLLSYLTLVY